MLKRKSTSPAQNRRSDACRSTGSTSAAAGSANLSTPSVKNARIRACFEGPYGPSATRTYLWVHCCMSVAHSAQAKLRIRLVNHKVFTRTAEAVGWKADWPTAVNGAERDVPLGSADNCWEIWVSS